MCYLHEDFNSLSDSMIWKYAVYNYVLLVTKSEWCTFLKINRIEQVFLSVMFIIEWLCSMTSASEKTIHNNLILKLKCPGTEVNKEQVLCMNIFYSYLICMIIMGRKYCKTF